MRSRAELKIDAKKKLNAYWKVPILVSIIIILISGLISLLQEGSPTMSTVLSFLFLSVAGVYSSMLYLNIAKNDNLDPVEFSWMNVSKEKLLKCLIYSALMYIGTFLISFLGSVVGVFIAALASIFIMILEVYLSFSILAILDTDAPILNSVQISMDLVTGNFFKIIVFGLSFVGWFMLGILTMGIGLVWVFPYFSISFANYYLELRRNKPMI